MTNSSSARKTTLITAIRGFLEKRLAAAPDEATRAKAVIMVSEYMIKAEAQSSDFYATCKDISGAMKKLNAIK